MSTQELALTFIITSPAVMGVAAGSLVIACEGEGVLIATARRLLGHARRRPRVSGFSAPGAENSSKIQRKFDCIVASGPSDVVDTTAHDELGAGHECGVRRQEEDRGSNFLRSADALQRDLRRNVILEALDLLLRETRFSEDWGLDRAGTHSVHPDVARRQLSRECPAE